jgi:hypothetical protein
MSCGRKVLLSDDRATYAVDTSRNGHAKPSGHAVFSSAAACSSFASRRSAVSSFDSRRSAHCRSAPCRSTSCRSALRRSAYRAPIDDGGALAMETARFRDIYNRIRPHQALDDRTPRQAYLDT